MGHGNQAKVHEPEGLKFGFRNSLSKQAAQSTYSILDFTESEYNLTTVGAVHVDQYTPPLPIPLVRHNEIL